jgi:hypothetical protein
MNRNVCATVVSVFLMAGAAAAVYAQQPAAASATLAGLPRDVACAPALSVERTEGPIKIIGSPQPRQKQFGTGESVIVGGGSAQGMRAGDEYYIRRLIEDRYAVPVRGGFPVTIHTAGVLRIVEARNDASIAVVTHACDGISDGDYIERFEPPVLPDREIGTTPDFGSPGHLILGAERRQTAAAGEFMVLDRGTDQGIGPGQKLTIFRVVSSGTGPVATIGTAKVYLVRPESATIRIESSVDAVYVGDLVAIHR